MEIQSFVLHDETVNTYGFRMLTSGANLEEFRKNPVMLLNHNDYQLPIGRWENIRVEGTRVLADAVFDLKDAEGKRVAEKVKDDFMRMASIGAWPPEEKSDAYDLMFPGQTLPTVTKWTVREASIVTVGANHNALAFYDRASKKIIDLNDRTNLIALMDTGNNQTQNIHTTMRQLTGLLKLSDTASEAEIASAVRGLLADNERLTGENKTLTTAIDKQNAAVKAAQQAEAVALADTAIKEGRYDATGRESLLGLFDKDFSGTKAMLAAIPRRTSAAGQIHAGERTSALALSDLTDKSWDELDKANKLTWLRDTAPDLYAQKFKQRFGVEPSL